MREATHEIAIGTSVLKRSGDEKLPSGSTIHWNEPDPENDNRCSVTCGRCKRKRLTTVPTGNALQNWSGFCKGCGHKQRFEDETLPSGSTIHWSQYDYVHRPHSLHWVTCGACGKKRLVSLPRTDILKGQYTGLCSLCARRSRTATIKSRSDELHASGAVIHWNIREPGNNRKVEFTCLKCRERQFIWAGNVRQPDWSGLCQKCRNQIKRVSSRKVTHEERHASGTMIHWNVRGPGKKDLIGITCHQCGEDSFFAQSQIKDRKYPWSGLCHGCIKKRGSLSPRKITGDIDLPSGSRIYFSRRNGKYVPILCGVCQKEWTASIESVKVLLSRHKRENTSWLGYCPKHQRSVAMVSAILRPPAAKPKRRGPEKGSTAIITAEKLRKAYETLGIYAPQEKVAEAIGVSDRALRAWQKEQGLTYPQLIQRFTSTGSN